MQYPTCGARDPEHLGFVVWGTQALHLQYTGSVVAPWVYWPCDMWDLSSLNRD